MAHFVVLRQELECRKVNDYSDQIPIPEIQGYREMHEISLNMLACSKEARFTSYRLTSLAKEVD